MGTFIGMLFLLLVVAVPVLGALYLFGVLTPTKIKSLNALSLPAQDIVKEFNSLPDSSKPDIDVVAAVEALDARFDKSKLNKHFTDYVYGNFTWTKSSTNNGFCRHAVDGLGYTACPYDDYIQLHNSIAGVKQELKNQQAKMVEADTQVGYDMVQEINARLAQEREILKSVTKEFL